MMQTKYQIIRQTQGTGPLNIGQPYVSRKRARSRVDTLDNQYGAYVHHVKTVLIMDSGRVWIDPSDARVS